MLRSEIGRTVEQDLSGRSGGLSYEYLRGYRDAVNHLRDLALTKQGQTPAVLSELETTWGLQATKVVDSPFSGGGIKVAVLDTGLDLNHPDFADRKITSKEFVGDGSVRDGNGHGTHCIGTAMGAFNPSILPRYGIAYNAEIFVGKVLSDRGSGSDRTILAGMEWAIANGCQIISMSLGARVFPGQSYSRIFENVGRRALRNGTLIIAAAGNDSDRPRRIQPVSHPANCPSIMAVGALDSLLEVAPFSNGGLNNQGGQIDIAAPGVNVYSSYPMPTRYRRLSGTSMATPHVAGIAALYGEATGATDRALWTILVQNALRLNLPSFDVGAGLAIAPLIRTRKVK